MAVPGLSISANTPPAELTAHHPVNHHLGWVLGNGMNWKRMNQGKVLEKLSLKAWLRGSRRDGVVSLGERLLRGRREASLPSPGSRNGPRLR